MSLKTEFVTCFQEWPNYYLSDGSFSKKLLERWCGALTSLQKRYISGIITRVSRDIAESISQ